jgi:glycosyltransferase involved in cell wall biosynthesis
MKRQRILLVIDALRPYGAERVAVDLAAAMRPYVEVAIVTYKGDANENASFAPSGVQHVHLRTCGTGLSRAVWTAAALWRLASGTRPVAMIGFMPYANTVTTIAGRACGVPVVATEHNVMSISEYGGRERPLLHFAMRRYVRRVEAVVAVSNAVADDLVVAFGARRERITTIYNPIDSRRILESAARGEPAVEPPSSPDELRIAVVGRLKRAKGHAVALRALTLLPAQYKLYLIGDGPLLDQLKGEAKKLGVANRVRFVGWQPEAAAWMDSAHVIWVPSLWEGFGLVLAEACVLGRAVIPSASPGLAEIAQLLGYAAVPPGDAEALARATADISSDARPHCRQGALSLFDPDHVATQYLDLVRRIAL